jgi:hypothetical protein
MTKSITTADLRPGQIVNFRTKLRIWRGYYVQDIAQAETQLTVRLPRDESATPQTWVLPLGDILPRTIELVAQESVK